MLFSVTSMEHIFSIVYHCFFFLTSNMTTIIKDCLTINSETVIQIESKLFLIVSHGLINFKFIFNLVLHNITNVRQLLIFHGEFHRFLQNPKR